MTAQTGPWAARECEQERWRLTGSLAPVPTAIERAIPDFLGMVLLMQQSANTICPCRGAVVPRCFEQRRSWCGRDSARRAPGPRRSWRVPIGAHKILRSDRPARRTLERARRHRINPLRCLGTAKSVSDFGPAASLLQQGNDQWRTRGNRTTGPNRPER